MIDLYTFLDERRATLDALMTELLVSEIREIEPIYFESATLLNSGLCNAILKRLDQYVGNFIYRFELVNKEDIEKINADFKTFQLTNNLLTNNKSCNMLEFNNTNSKVLYIGYRQNNLKLRIQEHFGFENSRTAALHLKKWISKDIKFKITIYELDSQNPDFIKFIGRGLEDGLHPLFFKRIRP